MPRPIDHNKVTRRYHGLDNNVLIEPARAVKLKCGHSVHGHPIAICPDRRELYVCPEGCGLQRTRAR